ncbi:hypothetical protein LTR66_014064, partial [Elasticomyces elasticus]
PAASRRRRRRTRRQPGALGHSLHRHCASHQHRQHGGRRSSATVPQPRRTQRPEGRAPRLPAAEHPARHECHLRRSRHPQGRQQLGYGGAELGHHEVYQDGLCGQQLAESAAEYGVAHGELFLV